MRASNRLLVYLLYDPSGRVDLSVQRTLRAFREVCDQILVVSNGPLTENSKEVLSSLAETVLERPNTGYDVAAYRHAFAGLGARLRSFDELVLANSTFFSVDESFEHLFDRMEKDPADFWGLTDHPEITPHPYTGQGVMRAHLQTYWLVFRSRVLHSPEFKSFWDALPIPETYDQVVTTFETELSHFFSQRGFTWSAAFPAKDFGVDNPTMQAPVALLDSGCPIVKKRLYFHGTEHLMNTGVSVAEVTEAALRRGLTREVIADAILGRTEATQATVALGALYVVDEPAQEPPGENENQGTVHTTQRTQRPWKELLATNDDLSADELLIVVPVSELEPRADGGIWRRHNALAAIKDGAERLAALMEAEPRLGMVAPLLQFVGTLEPDVEWLDQARRGWEVARALGLQDDASHHGPICAYQGIAAYRASALAGFAERIQAGGGWDALAVLAGGEEQLEVTLDQLIASHMLQRGYYAGQATTLKELKTESPLWMTQAQAHFARFSGYSGYMQNWKVLPTSPSRGQAMWVRSDRPFVYKLMSFTYRRTPRAHLLLNSLYNRAHAKVERKRKRGA